jgi:hypothetical protein
MRDKIANCRFEDPVPEMKFKKKGRSASESKDADLFLLHRKIGVA